MICDEKLSNSVGLTTFHLAEVKQAPAQDLCVGHPHEADKRDEQNGLQQSNEDGYDKDIEIAFLVRRFGEVEEGHDAAVVGHGIQPAAGDGQTLCSACALTPRGAGGSDR